jgi:hypothetical protein
MPTDRGRTDRVDADTPSVAICLPSQRGKSRLGTGEVVVQECCGNRLRFGDPARVVPLGLKLEAHGEVVSDVDCFDIETEVERQTMPLVDVESVRNLGRTPRHRLCA